jgi:peptidoglycan/LPS O-acetylase OafA/YrhL
VPAISGDIRQHWVAAASSLYAMNWVRAFDLGPTKLLGHTWSLAIEEQFYLIWPVVLLALLSKRIDPVKVICALILAVVSWRLILWRGGATQFRLYCGSDTRADVLLIGCLIASAPKVAERLARFYPLAVAFLLLVALRRWKGEIRQRSHVWRRNCGRITGLNRSAFGAYSLDDQTRPVD